MLWESLTSLFDAEWLQYKPQICDSELWESDKLVNYQGVLQIKQMNHNTYKSLFIRKFTLMRQISGSWTYKRIRRVKSLDLRKRSIFIYKVIELV